MADSNGDQSQLRNRRYGGPTPGICGMDEGAYQCDVLTIATPEQTPEQ